MRPFALLGLLGVTLLGLLPSAHAAPARNTRIAGIDWEPSFAAAQARARKEHKPILELHLFGRLDEEFC